MAGQPDWHMPLMHTKPEGHDVAMHWHVAVTGSQTGVQPVHMPLQGSADWQRLFTQFWPAAQHTPLHSGVVHVPVQYPLAHACPAPQQVLPQT
jgi:hypothetical protein